MKKYILCALFVPALAVGEDGDVHVVVSAQQHAQTPVALVLVGKVNKEFVACLKADLEMTGQCKVEISRKKEVTKESEIRMMFEQGSYMALFISQYEWGYSWRLYDTMDAHMLDGKKFLCSHKPVRESAHNIADFVWPVMMGQPGSFSSQIAYCRQNKIKEKNKVYKQILLSEIDGSNERLLIDLPTVSLAPRWNMDITVPVLFYSENTLSNVRLMMANMFGKRRVVCSFDGLNMQPAFSEDGKEIVFCLSKDGSTQLYRSYLVDGEQKYSRLTHNEANNFAPCFIDQKNIVFVSDYQGKKPQLYSMNIETQEITAITQEGYNACPCYNKIRNQIVYSKMVSGKMQLFLYDCALKKHEQLTSGGSCSNEEPSWSPCGNFIVYCSNEGLNGRIVRLNMITKSKIFLTPKSWNCSYPSWSPVYSSWLE
jgi:TolB protein